jgi:predicted dehydrogenase
MIHKAAVIGTGFIGPVHIEALRRAGVEVVGVLGSSSSKSVATAERLRLNRAYQNLDELLNDASVDSVHVASPNGAHFEQASKCLKAGKHVLCEKPLAMNSEESAELVELARRCGLAAGVNYNIRYYPLCIEAAERRRQGEIGEIYHVTGGYVQDWLFHPSDFNWRVVAELGGRLRAMADIGTHWLDLILSITGLEVEAVCADLQTVFDQRQRPLGGAETFSGKLDKREAVQRQVETIAVDTEDFGSVLIRFRGGSRGVLHVSQVTAGRKNCLRWEIAGSKQALSWDSEQPNEMWIGHRDQPNQLLSRDPALMHRRAAEFASYPAGHNEGFPDSFKQLFTDFYRAIEDQSFQTRPSFPSFADGHREILLCEAILKSAQEDRWVQV